MPPVRMSIPRSRKARLNPALKHEVTSDESEAEIEELRGDEAPAASLAAFIKEDEAGSSSFKRPSAKRPKHTTGSPNRRPAIKVTDQRLGSAPSEGRGTGQKKWTVPEREALLRAAIGQSVPQAKFEGVLPGRTARLCKMAWEWAHAHHGC